MKYVLLAILLSGCTLFDNKLPLKLYDPRDEIKLDLKMIIDNKVYDGVANIEAKDFYNVRIIAPGEIDWLIVKSCNLEHTFEKEWNIDKQVKGGFLNLGTKWIKVKNMFDYKLEPTDRQINGNCNYQISALNDKGEHSFGFINITKKDETEHAVIDCNGVIGNHKGSFACNIRDGLRVEIRSFKEAKLNTIVRCGPINEKVKGRVFEFVAKKALCPYVLKTNDGFFRLSTIGYTKLPERKHD